MLFPAHDPGIMKLLYLSLFVCGTAVSALGCDLCAVYSANQAHGERGRGFFVGAADQFTHFATTQFDGNEVPNTADQELNSGVTQFLVGYNFNDRFGVQLNTPIISRSFRRAEGFDIDEGTESGLGDISLLGTWRVLRFEEKKSTFAWSILGGVKLPTGSSDRLFEEVLELSEPPPPAGAPDSAVHGHDLALGSGSVDGIVGTSIYGRYQRVFLTANVQYAIRTEGDFAYEYANDIVWNGGPGVFLVLNESYTIAGQLVVSGEHKGTDTFRGMSADDTGITAVYVGPQVNFTWSDKLGAEVGFDIPVHMQNTDFQIVPDYRVRGALTWHF